MVVLTRARVLAIGGVLAAATAHAEEPSPQQKIALTAKPSVVRVWGAYLAKFDLEGNIFQEAIGGSGTGFFITPDGYIATNAHVVADVEAGDAAATKKLGEMLFQDVKRRFPDQLARMSPDQIRHLGSEVRLIEQRKLAFVVLPNGDKLDYEVKQFGTPGTGRDCAIIRVKTSNAPTLPIGDSTRSQVEDRIVVIGYPGVADMKELLDAKSQLEASVTDGAISSLKTASTGEQILQISAPITHGNSGGPAIDQHGNVVGLATFGNEGEVQGFNFLVASATLKQLIKDAKIEPSPSETNQVWRQGLEHYWADEYTPAIASFEQVETLFPQHSEAPRLITLSHQAQKDGKEKQPSGSPTMIVAIAAGGGALLIGLVIVLLVRRKPATIAAPRAGMPYAMPGQPMQGQPMPGQPMPGQPMPGQPMPGQPMPGSPYGMQPPMYGRAPMAGAAAPVAKTVAIQQGAPTPGGIGQTAVGTMAIGSLQCTRGRLYGQRFALIPTGIIVGRQPGVAHVLIDDQRASGKHVWIGIDNGRLVAIDQGTTNGTYINDLMRGRITRAELRDGDTVIVGEPDCLSLQVRLGVS
jgi:S1-C subfamily serine protease